MNASRIQAFLAGALLALLVAMAAWPLVTRVTAQADTATADAPVVVQGFDGSSPFVVPAAAFQSDGFDPDSHFFPFGGGYLRGNSAADGCVVAPVYVQEAVTLRAMWASVYDNSSTYNAYVNLRRIDNFTGAHTDMAFATTSGMPNSTNLRTVSDQTIQKPLILYPQYTYYLTTCLQSDQVRLYSVRLYFAKLAFVPYIDR